MRRPQAGNQSTNQWSYSWFCWRSLWELIDQHSNAGEQRHLTDTLCIAGGWVCVRCMNVCVCCSHSHMYLWLIPSLFIVINQKKRKKKSCSPVTEGSEVTDTAVSSRWRRSAGSLTQNSCVGEDPQSVVLLVFVSFNTKCFSEYRVLKTSARLPVVPLVSPFTCDSSVLRCSQTKSEKNFITVSENGNLERGIIWFQPLSFGSTFRETDKEKRAKLERWKIHKLFLIGPICPPKPGTDLEGVSLTGFTETPLWQCVVVHAETQTGSRWWSLSWVFNRSRALWKQQLSTLHRPSLLLTMWASLPSYKQQTFVPLMWTSGSRADMIFDLTTLIMSMIRRTTGATMANTGN